MPFESLLGPTVTTWIAHAVAALTAFALLYGAAKILWTRLSGRPFPANKVTRALDALAELGTNVLGFINKATRGNGAPLLANPDVQRRDALIAEMSTALDDLRRRVGDAPLPLVDAAGKAGAVAVSETRGFDPAARQTIAPDVVAEARRITDASERGSVDLRTLGAIVVVLAAGAPMGALIAGCPRLPPVSGCQPEAQTCIADSPHVCSASQRWHRAGDLTCTQVGAVCLVAGGRAYCGAAADGGL